MSTATLLLFFSIAAMQNDEPSRFPQVTAPEFPLPKTLEEWGKRRVETRATLERLLGDLPARPAKPAVKVVEQQDRKDYRLEKLSIDNGAGAQIPAWLLIPKGPGPFPGILYCHWHAGQYNLGKEELWQDAPDGNGKRGEALVKQGYVVLAIDAYGFGERSGLGPDGPKQKGGQEEMSLSKAFLWMGR